MKPSIKIAHLVTLFVLVCSFASGLVQAHETGNPNDKPYLGVVTQSEGVSSVIRPEGSKETLAVGTRLYPGDTIEVGEEGSLEVSLENPDEHLVMTLGPNAIVVLSGDVGWADNHIKNTSYLQLFSNISLKVLEGRKFEFRGGARFEVNAGPTRIVPESKSVALVLKVQDEGSGLDPMDNPQMRMMYKMALEDYGVDSPDQLSDEELDEFSEIMSFMAQMMPKMDMEGLVLVLKVDEGSVTLRNLYPHPETWMDDVSVTAGEMCTIDSVTEPVVEESY